MTRFTAVRGLRFRLLAAFALVAAVSALATEVEAKSGLTTQLPVPMKAPVVKVGGSAVTIRLQPGLPRISETALAQLTCTAATAWRLTDPRRDKAQLRVTVLSAATADVGGEGGATASAPAGWQAEQDGAKCLAEASPVHVGPGVAPTADPVTGGTGGLLPRPQAPTG